MKDLMIHVEQIVRPIRGDWSKLRMRRELLAHLQSAYEQERAGGLDEAAAIAEAKRRLGDPATLREELQASVSRLERLAGTRFSARGWMMLLSLGVLLAMIVAIAPVPASLTSRQAGSFASVTEVAPAHARAILVAGILTMELSFLFWYAFTTEFFRPRMRWPRVACAGIAAFVAQLASIFLVLFALTGHAASDDFGQVALAQLILPAFLASSGVVTLLARRPMKQWLELDIAN